MNAVDIVPPSINEQLPIRAHADEMQVVEHGNYKIYQLYGHCQIQQGPLVGQAAELTLWVDKASEFNGQKPVKILVRLAGAVDLQWSQNDRLQDASWSGRMLTIQPLDIRAEKVTEGTSDSAPQLWTSAPASIYTDPVDSNGRTNTGVVPAQYSQPSSNPVQGSFSAPSSPLGGIVLDNAGNIVEEIQAVPQQQQVFQVPTLDPSSVPNLSGPNIGSIPSSIGPVVNGSPTIVPDPTTGVVPVETPNRSRIGAQSFLMTGRGSGNYEIQIKTDQARNESVIVVTRGVRLSFSGAAYQSTGGQMDLGTVTLEADRVVIWTTQVQQLMSGNASQIPIEVYLDGNVVFQQGLRKVYADRMYYDAQAEIGTIINAEILTPVPMYEGILRLKADVVQQRSRQNFLAYDAAITSSRLGVPRYWLQADRLELKDERDPNDPNQALNSQRTETTNMEATARNNFVYIDRIPVFYWPYINTNVDSPSFFVTGGKFKNDDIFGQQVYVDSDLYQILGINGIDGTRWTLSTDYLSKRGFALGTTFRFNTPSSIILDGPTNGYLDIWGLHDRGKDVLGADRINLTPEETTRGRGIFRMRQLLSRDWEFRAEAGLISDRNFLEQYFEREWDQEKDQTTTLRLRHYNENQMLDIWGQVRLNDFFTETEWLPRLDYFVLGQSFFDRFTWYANTNVGYAKQQIASVPTDPQDAATFQYLPWEANVEGIRAGTRQELAMPLTAGPFKFVPYVGGEVMAYGENLNGDSITRLTGQAGIRSSLPMWRVYDDIQSRIFNINGLAHKMNWHSEFFYSDTNKSLDQIPLYDPLDDNSQEHFRRRMIFNTFGGSMPAQFDSRNFAVRQGLQRYVTANSLDVVADQMQFRVGLDQRWQTKRGLPGRERIADLYEVDFGAVLFPKADRDDFGKTIGAVTYASRLHLGDRVTLLGDGYADLFDDGLKVLSSGVSVSRPGLGQITASLSRLTGPIDSTILSAYANYRLNEKFLVSGGTTFDFGEVGNVGQTVALTRVGESFLIQVGANVDSGRNNTVFTFSLEPRFFPIRGLGAVGGKLIPPAGTYGLE